MMDPEKTFFGHIYRIYSQLHKSLYLLVLKG